MRMTVFQPVAVYPEPARNAWQVVHWAATISFPFPSGSSWLRAGNTEDRTTAAIKDGNFGMLIRMRIVLLGNLLRTSGEVQRYGLHLEGRLSRQNEPIGKCCAGLRSCLHSVLCGPLWRGRRGPRLRCLRSTARSGLRS